MELLNQSASAQLTLRFSFDRPVEEPMGDHRGWKFYPERCVVAIHNGPRGDQSIGYLRFYGKRTSGLESTMAFTVADDSISAKDHSRQPTPDWVVLLWDQIRREYSDEIDSIRRVPTSRKTVPRP